MQTKGVPLDIAAHSMSIGYAAAMPTSSIRGVAVVLVYSLKTNPQLFLHIGFTNPHSDCSKIFIEMGLQKVPVREIYDKTLDEFNKTLNVERFRVVAINKNQDRNGEMEITIEPSQ